MYTDMAIQLHQYINSLQEPTKSFVGLGIYIGLPILCFLLLLLNNTLEKRKGEK